ncbi:MAG: chemotaxis protein, partial [Clostridiales bacterium]|nr:chemotaxis protein [Clostridiales bacterium]
KTEQIQNTIKKVECSSDTIRQNMDETQRELAESERNINDLIGQVQISNEANENVSRELEKLYTYTNQMQSIVQMINDVTEQTSLLALNASIEAARAGEAGKGFAVVASEISALATQTQQATVNITNLINNISSELSQVVEVIHQMMKNVEVQNQATDNTARSFGQIAVCIEKVGNESRSLAHLVVELSDANSEIIRGIETISAATEEVTAHSSETLESSEENNSITGEVSTIVDQLHTLAQDLSGTQLD